MLDNKCGGQNKGDLGLGEAGRAATHCVLRVGPARVWAGRQVCYGVSEAHAWLEVTDSYGLMRTGAL